MISAKLLFHTRTRLDLHIGFDDAQGQTKKPGLVVYFLLLFPDLAFGSKI